jgi:hypothetical protein
MASIFAVAGMILGMAPHVWHGTTAAQDWFRDVLVEGEQHGVSGHVVTLSEPRHVSVTGDNAYVVVPSSMTFKVHGKQVRQPGATVTWLSASSTKSGASGGLGIMGKTCSIAAQMITSGHDFSRDL